MDMSSRKTDTLSKEKELNKQLDKISHDENNCIAKLKNDIIKLLNDEQSKNMALIEECKDKENTILNALFLNSTRTEILINRLNICQQYMYNL